MQHSKAWTDRFIRHIEPMFMDWCDKKELILEIIRNDEAFETIWTNVEIEDTPDNTCDISFNFTSKKVGDLLVTLEIDAYSINLSVFPKSFFPVHFWDSPWSFVYLNEGNCHIDDYYKMTVSEFSYERIGKICTLSRAVIDIDEIILTTSRVTGIIKNTLREAEQGFEAIMESAHKYKLY